MLKLLFIVFICCGTVVYSDPGLHKIEIIVFENTNAADVDTEIWPTFIGQLDLDSGIDVTSENNLLLGSDWELTTESNEISKSKHFKLLQHIAWQQDVVEQDDRNFLVTGSSQSKFGQSSSVEGLIQITPLRNLYRTNLDFILSKSSAKKRFRLEKKSKLKKNETYFFDHPYFGILLRISSLA